jgi:hypothetical protein
MIDDMEMLHLLTRICSDDEICYPLPLSPASTTTSSHPTSTTSVTPAATGGSLPFQSLNQVQTLFAHSLPPNPRSLPSVPQQFVNSSSSSSFPQNNSPMTSKKRRITDSPNADDSKIIAASTAEQVRLLNIDPDSKEGKKEQRRIRNRMSAMMHRERKKQYIETLEDEVQEKNDMIHRLRTELSMALEENKQLKAKLEQQQQQPQSAPAISPSTSAPLGSHALTHQEFLGALARPQPTYPATALPSSAPLPPVLTRGRAGTTVTSNEGSGSDSECSVSDLNQMWRGDRSTSSGLDSDELDESIRESWREYLSSETSLNPSSLSPSPASLSHSLTPSLTPSPSPPDNRRRSVPLYSFVLLLTGLSFFSGMFPSPISLSLGDILPPFQLPAPPTHSLEPAPHLPSFSPKVGGGRVLLSLPTTGAEMDRQQQTPLPSSSAYSHELAPVIWNHPSHVTSIFPYPLNPRATVALQNDSQRKRRYLRAEINSTEEEGKDVMAELTQVYSTKELAFFYDNTWPSSASSMSKIYLTDGRALLDPSLVAAALPPHPRGDADSASLSKAIIPSWQVTPSSATTTSSSSSRGSSFSNSSPSPTSASSPNQLLTMIIPATTIQWGGSGWIDGDSPHASHNILDLLMRNMNLTSYAMENGLFDEDNNIDISHLSVEIACNVLKARIVKDVVVLSDSGSGHRDKEEYDA